MKYSFGNRHEPLGEFDERQWNASRPQWKQVHGVKIHEVKEPHEECGEVDGLWTRNPEIPVTVITADCVPILLYQAEEKAVAALHAGWRGTFGKIISSFFAALPGELADPKSWTAFIGPCIHACCYEVSETLISDFLVQFPEIPQAKIEASPRHLDLLAVNQFQLERLGVQVAFAHPHCTFCTRQNGEPTYFSYRRGDRNSRQYSSIQISS